MHKFPIIIYTDEQFTKKVRTIQQELYALTGSRACLDLWEPHITIGSAVMVKEVDTTNLFNDMEKALANSTPFQVQIKNFGFMDNWPGGNMGSYTPYVIYLDVMVNNELLELAQNIRDQVTSKRERSYNMPWPYTPHLTVAFKDLGKQGFEKARLLLKDRTFEHTTTIDHVAIADDLPDGTCPMFKKWNL